MARSNALLIVLFRGLPFRFDFSGGNNLKFGVQLTTSFTKKSISTSWTFPSSTIGRLVINNQSFFNHSKRNTYIKLQKSSNGT
jgi:hypothetical protein